jgi:hypothetical protein
MKMPAVRVPVRALLHYVACNMQQFPWANVTRTLGRAASGKVLVALICWLQCSLAHAACEVSGGNAPISKKDNECKYKLAVKGSADEWQIASPEHAEAQRISVKRNGGSVVFYLGVPPNPTGKRSHVFIRTEVAADQPIRLYRKITGSAEALFEKRYPVRESNEQDKQKIVKWYADFHSEDEIPKPDNEFEELLLKWHQEEVDTGTPSFKVVRGVCFQFCVPGTERIFTLPGHRKFSWIPFNIEGKVARSITIIAADGGENEDDGRPAYRFQLEITNPL